MAKCKESHEPDDYVQCDDCEKKGCSMCEEGWTTDFEEGLRRCPICSAQNRLQKRSSSSSERSEKEKVK